MIDLKAIINDGTTQDFSLLREVTMCLCDVLQKKLDKEEYLSLCKKTYCKVNGGHYNKEFAELQIPKMYYVDKRGEEQHAPYYTEVESKKIYEKVKDKIPNEYNFYDFDVALNMIYSDNIELLCKWSDVVVNTTTLPAEWVEDKIVELTVNWLDDDDNPFGTEKVWRYFNSGGGKG